MQLRNTVLALSPAEIGVSPSAETPRVWGVLMETGYPEGMATLVALADGTVSLYLGSGGGIIGGGQHPNVGAVGKLLLVIAETHLRDLSPTTTFPTPDAGRVRFYVLTFSGTLTAEADEQQLGAGQHRLSKLFHAGQNVLAALRDMAGQAGE